MPEGARQQLLSQWQRLGNSGPGRWLFARILGRMIPYTGSIGATVLELAPGHAKTVLRDRRSVRNHLRSVHAIALANLGEFTTGLAMTAAMPDEGRAILVGLQTRYLKKARGTLTAEANVELPPITGDLDLPVVAHVRDQAGDVVCEVIADWRIGPAKARKS